MGGLDPIGRKEFRDIILELKEQGKTIFFSSHILSDAEVISDRIGILNKGKLVREASLSDLFDMEVESFEITCRWSEQPPEQWPSDCTGIQQDHQSTLFASDEQTAQKAVQWVLENKGRVLTMVPHRKTLEDIFMEEMKN
jgi:ABC-2 type transport system ATP-binding protein